MAAHVVRLAAVAAVVVALVPTWGAALDRASAERELVTLTNSDRTSNGLVSLRPHDGLIGVARDRSQDMAVRNYFSHEIPPDGHYFEDLLDRAGIHFQQAGENIARNNYPDGETARRAQTGFLNSPAHRANIMDPVYRELGIGAWDRSDGMKYFTVLFLRGSGAGAHAPTAPFLASHRQAGHFVAAADGRHGDYADTRPVGLRALVALLVGAPQTAQAQAEGGSAPGPGASPGGEGSGRRVTRGAPATEAPAGTEAASARAVAVAQPAPLGLLDGIITRVLKLYLSM
jgi:hypothetical protein